MNKGQIISGAGHLGLIGWALLGGVFPNTPETVEIAQVTTISEAEFAALVQRSASPGTTEAVRAPQAPEAVPREIRPEARTRTETAPAQMPPPERAEPTPDPLPETRPEPLPERPAAQLIDEAPVVTPPQEEVAMLPTPSARRPRPRPAQRIAPEPVAPPEPDVRPDDVAQVPAAPSTEPAEQTEPAREETAPEETATTIVPEADEAAPAPPSASVRPRTRPAVPAEQPASQAATAGAAEPPDRAAAATDTGAVNAALAEALGQVGGQGGGAAARDAGPSGPPMTEGEKDGLRVAVQRCWNVGSLSSDALATTVTVTVQMTEDSKPVPGSIRMTGSSGGSDVSARQAFEAARRAIIRCGASGFDLPREKYAEWREIEMTFNPESMRIR